jgi:hypothetical protein
LALQEEGPDDLKPREVRGIFLMKFFKKGNIFRPEK